ACNYADGEWVPHDSPPMYNGTTCPTIKQGQNCMSSGRPDRDYLRWKWKPHACDLPSFDPLRFLHLLQNKTIAFVGDSLARNQMESLLCMLSTVSNPLLLYASGEDNKFRKWHFPSHNSNLSIYWSPFLVQGIEKNNDNNYNTMFLDSVDRRWSDDLGEIDVLVACVGHWFLLPAVYYQKNSIAGCHAHGNCTETDFYGAYEAALKTAFREVVTGKENRVASLLFTTFTPAHFEGEWDKLGSCSRTRPYGKMILEGMNAEMRRIGMEQVREARREGGSVACVEALDVTTLAMTRPDGHPGPYMYPFPFANGVPERVQNDCVHWCLPGPIDTWNQILLDAI
ncbi:hypothetical protein M569_07422, partial [Genlisea aurea]